MIVLRRTFKTVGRWLWTLFCLVVAFTGTLLFYSCLHGCSLLRVDMPHGILGPASEPAGVHPPAPPGQGPPPADESSPWLAAGLGALVVLGDVAGILHRRKFHQKK